MTDREYNQLCVEKLKRHGFENRVAVIGSGLSYHLVTNIGELVDSMKGPCGIEKMAEEPHWDFFDRAYKSNPEKYHQIIKESFGNRHPWDARAYWHIVNIKFKSFVTLNIDDQLPSAFQRARCSSNAEVFFNVYPGQSIYLPPDLSGNKQRLVAVHGYKNEKDPEWHKKLILRKGDYSKHYYWENGNPPPFLYVWWYWLLTTQPCVFIGTSLEEPGLAVVIRNIIDGGNEVIKGLHIHLKPTAATSPDYAENDVRSLGVIQQIRYAKVDEDHSGLNFVLSHFSGQPESSPVPLSEPKIYSINDNLDFLKTLGGKL